MFTMPAAANYRMLTPFFDEVFDKVSKPARDVLLDLQMRNQRSIKVFLSVATLYNMAMGHDVDEDVPAEVVQNNPEMMDVALSVLDEIKEHVPGWSYDVLEQTIPSGEKWLMVHPQPLFEVDPQRAAAFHDDRKISIPKGTLDKLIKDVMKKTGR